MAKLQGCSKDHAKEIDLYGKSYDDKLAQIREMMDQARSALKEMDIDGAKPDECLQKACYYFAQANLVFFYLIPETP